jgi:iron complex outermembrane receptor protein
MLNSKIVLLAGVAAVAMSIPAFASAQTSAPAADASGTKLETVVVTARKRSEDVLKVPTAVTAISGAALEQRGLQSLDDISKFTPGMADNQANAGSARSDRSFQSIIIRGMNPSNTLLPTTSIFINGTPVPSGDMIQSLGDVDHVEILKGPQSAYFGRSTFAGAVNVISKSGTNYWTGDFTVEAGTRNTYGLMGQVSGPIIADKLMVTFGGKWDKHDGSYQNAFNRSQTLGDQEDQSFHFGFTAKPVDNLTIKAYGLWFENNDGAPATGVYQAAAGSFSQGNCTIAGTPFFCGTLPGLNYAITPAQNTSQSPTLSNFLANPGGIIPTADTVKNFGLKRIAYHTDLSVEYVVPNLGLTFTNLLAYNQDKFSELSDLANLDTAAGGPYPGFISLPGYGGFDYMVQGTHANISEEFRVTTDATKRYRALLGVSYIRNEDNNAIGTTSLVNVNNPTRSITKGVFFSLAYDITPKITVNFDGRYQSDEEHAYTYAYVQTVAGSVNNFLPRASIQYKFTPDVMAYFTYSQGANPPLLNAQYANLPAVSRAEITSTGIAASSSALPEQITNYEVGFKGRFLDGRATMAIDLYYDDWTNQINSGSYVFAASDPLNPINLPGNQSYNPTLLFKSADPVSFFANAASSNAKGIEFEGQFIPVEHVTLNGGAAYNDTQYTKFICTSCQPYVTFDAHGKYLPNAPLFSASFGAQYANTMHMFARPMDWFARMDFAYRDGLYIQASNTVKTPSTTLLNFTAGLTLGHGMSIEGYVKNATNNHAPVSGFQAFNFTTFSNTAVNVALPQLITGGVKLKYKF